jgi:hypothetical protein
MDFSKRVLDAGARTQGIRFAAPYVDIAALVQPRTVRRGVAINLPKAENLQSWENEGGATAPAPSFVQRVTRPGTAPQAAKYQSLSEDAPRGADTEASATHTLTVMRISLLLLIPAVGAGAIFWGLLVGSAPR